jgi:hypothetical protein
MIAPRSRHAEIVLAAREIREEAAELRSQATLLCLEVKDRRADHDERRIDGAFQDRFRSFDRRRQVE